ncbi:MULTISPECIES: GerW family sporulation protein [Caproicibacterium]|jgi:sporulation protein YtfJ|uniref:Sporulation protein YtfJ n=1 Tax=Caproicibacterium lactatifermentans TaxID=2666138 RepID=A0A859DQD2_9FIRM|nr:GerW family sporulation protein [Caproicibacterium lactatifermentans]ARP50269.1 sporulation protein YtfJ [Ruminococcaceae bacterium CPB6]QKN24010.1 sporulation protein YtfJ [Caproicibacterium lactatifermentans]QKO30919.1 sporulation protein YtfJ [Caproicibacterium lactatifermentans]
MSDSNHPIEGMMDTTLQNIRQMVDINTIIGDPITAPDGTIIIPISKISYGFASGGSDFACKANPDKDFFGGGAGAGVSISPVAFLTISNGNVKMLQIDPYNSSTDRIVGMVPDIVDKVNEMINGKKKKKDEQAAAKQENTETQPQK